MKRSRVSESVFGIVTTFYATTVDVVHMHVAGSRSYRGNSAGIRLYTSTGSSTRNHSIILTVTPISHYQTFTGRYLVIQKG